MSGNWEGDAFFGVQWSRKRRDRRERNLLWGHSTGSVFIEHLLEWWTSRGRPLPGACRLAGRKKMSLVEG